MGGVFSPSACNIPIRCASVLLNFYLLVMSFVPCVPSYSVFRGPNVPIPLPRTSGVLILNCKLLGSLINMEPSRVKQPWWFECSFEVLISKSKKFYLLFIATLMARNQWTYFYLSCELLNLQCSACVIINIPQINLYCLGIPKCIYQLIQSYKYICMIKRPSSLYFVAASGLAFHLTAAVIIETNFLK